MGIQAIKKGSNYVLCDVDENGKFKKCEQIVKSWSNKVNYVVEDENKNQVGLRTAQLGAVFAIRAHWTVSDLAATIVMPTGTGKTETMITTIVAEQRKKVFVLVPTNLLRTQTVENCVRLGILKDINVVDTKAKLPNVLCLRSTPKTKEDLKELLNMSNIIVSTASLISRFDESYMNLINQECDTLIVDEAHHIKAQKWEQIKSSFAGKKILQFTATPFRNDGKKLDGEIIYNFPLSQAQREGYFQKINFMPIVEFDDEKGDSEIAKAAIHKLQEDINKGYKHTVLVRTDNVKRAEKLYNDIYLKMFKVYNPVLILGKMPDKEKKEKMDKLKNGESKVVVCVDIFGEGIDIPSLKIAAIHDKYKSLPITLQFVGRFARNKKGLGEATVITNIANEDIQDALKELYSQDSNWNSLLSEMSSSAIGKEISLQKLANGFIGTGIDTINVNQLKPKLSMVAYSTNKKEWNWRNWEKAFEQAKCKYYVNEDEHILIVVEANESKIEWAYYKEINNLNWNLHILYWNDQKKVVFINSTDKSAFNKFAESVFDDAKRLSGESIFKCLYGINRLMLANVGLNSAIDGPIRYKMFTGIDIVGAISESQKGNSYKSNLFGIGYNGNGKISIGCSHKGTVWSRWVESIDYWKNWCNEVYDKINNPNISTKDVLEGVLQPEIIYKRPKEYAYRIDWPNEFDISCETNIYIQTNFRDIPIYEMEIGLIQTTDSEPLKFYVKSMDESEEFTLTIDDKGFYFNKVKSANFILHVGKKEYSLTEYFKIFQPTIKFINQATLQGNYYIKANVKSNLVFPKKNILVRKWDKLGVNIQKESQKLTKEKDSIQYSIIQELKNKNEYTIIFDDDNSGEIADIVAIKEEIDRIKIEFYHCKYSHEKKAGSRVADLYEVCGQAEKSVTWKQDVIRIMDRMKYRESYRMKKNKVSRFELGDIKTLNIIRNKLKVMNAQLEIYIVQPGVDSKNITGEMNQLLCGTSAYLMETYGVHFKMICS